MVLPLIANHSARHLFLDRHALGGPRTSRAPLAELIDRIGFVQVDSINTVARAHDLILFSRDATFRAQALTGMLERDRSLFEHWTHDAALVPMRLFPHWRHRFARDAVRLESQWRRFFRDGYAQQFDQILHRIAKEGPVTTADVGTGEVRGTSGGWWDWHPSKTALEWLWRTGALAITRRTGFRKVYDLTERVIPAEVLATRVEATDSIDWSCASALGHLGFATPSEIAAFWDATSLAEAKAWVVGAQSSGRIVPVTVEGADGRIRTAFAFPGVAEEAAALPAPPPVLRILSPFDPSLRDRARAEALFGFRYRIEVFVPEARRTYGYYVFPVLEGARIVGRLDAKADRAARVLAVRAFWPERGTPFSPRRARHLTAELERLAVLAGCADLVFAPDWLRDPL